MNQTTVPKPARELVHQRIDKMTRALRVLGAVLLLTSASSFLVHRWDSGHDLLRFGFLLCHSFVILAAALFCGGKLGESRSARVFLWTNLAMIPAHFSVLGGLVYSQFALDSQTELLPSYAVWQAPSPLSVIPALLATFITVVSTGLISARVLAPRRAKHVTLLFVGLCSLLLVPLRLTDAAAIIAAVAALTALFYDRKVFARDYRMRTREGRMVRALMAVPSALIVGRAAIFYPTTATFIGMLILIAGVIGFLLSQSIENNPASVDAGEWLSTLASGVGLVFILSGTHAFREIGPLALLTFPALFVLASRASKRGRSGFEIGASLSATVVCAIALGVDPGLFEAVCALLIGAAVLASSILMGRALVAAAAGLCVLAGISVIFDRAIGFEHLGSWGTLSALGILAVLAAALLERHRDRLLHSILKRFGSEASPPGLEESMKGDKQGVNYSPSTPVTQA